MKKQGKKKPGVKSPPVLLDSPAPPPGAASVESLRALVPAPSCADLELAGERVRDGSAHGARTRPRHRRVHLEPRRP
jgi:hypothetical protein